MSNTLANPFHFETALNTLEQMVEKLGSGQLSLEEALKSFEEGIHLARQCQEALKTAEQKVQMLTENGPSSFEPFEGSL